VCDGARLAGDKTLLFAAHLSGGATSPGRTHFAPLHSALSPSDDALEDEDYDEMDDGESDWDDDDEEEDEDWDEDDGEDEAWDEDLDEDDDADEDWDDDEDEDEDWDEDEDAEEDEQGLHGIDH
jgi:hypothetical protein